MSDVVELALRRAQRQARTYLRARPVGAERAVALLEGDHARPALAVEVLAEIARGAVAAHGDDARDLYLAQASAAFDEVTADDEAEPGAPADGGAYWLAHERTSSVRAALLDAARAEGRRMLGYAESVTHDAGWRVEVQPALGRVVLKGRIAHRGVEYGLLELSVALHAWALRGSVTGDGIAPWEHVVTMATDPGGALRALGRAMRREAARLEAAEPPGEIKALSGEAHREIRALLRNLHRSRNDVAARWMSAAATTVEAMVRT